MLMLLRQTLRPRSKRHSYLDCSGKAARETCDVLIAAFEEVKHGRATSKSLRPVSKSGQTRAQPHFQVARRSQRQQQQRQLKDKQLQAEKLHTVRISARAKTPAAVTTTNGTRSSSKGSFMRGVMQQGQCMCAWNSREVSQ